MRVRKKRLLKWLQKAPTELSFLFHSLNDWLLLKKNTIFSILAWASYIIVSHSVICLYLIHYGTVLLKCIIKHYPPLALYLFSFCEYLIYVFYF